MPEKTRRYIELINFTVTNLSNAGFEIGRNDIEKLWRVVRQEISDDETRVWREDILARELLAVKKIQARQAWDLTALIGIAEELQNDVRNLRGRFDKCVAFRRRNDNISGTLAPSFADNPHGAPQ